MKTKTVVTLLFICSLIFIFRFTMFSYSSLGIGTSKGEINLIPFYTIGSTLYSSLTDFVVNVGGNIALFIPLGFTLPLKYPNMRKTLATTSAGFSLSIVIECIQLLMPDRCTDIDDVILNTLGTYIGFLLNRKFIQYIEPNHYN